MFMSAACYTVMMLWTVALMSKLYICGLEDCCKSTVYLQNVAMSSTHYVYLKIFFENDEFK